MLVDDGSSHQKVVQQLWEIQIKAVYPPSLMLIYQSILKCFIPLCSTLHPTLSLRTRKTPSLLSISISHTSATILLLLPRPINPLSVAFYHSPFPEGRIFCVATLPTLPAEKTGSVRESFTLPTFKPDIYKNSEIPKSSVPPLPQFFTGWFKQDPLTPPSAVESRSL